MMFNSVYAEIEDVLGVEPPPMLREHPSATLYDAARLLIQTHARRVPLLDEDSETGHEVIISVLTQYRLLKFISINVSGSPPLILMVLTFCQCMREIYSLQMPLRKLKIGTYVSSWPPSAEGSSDGNPYHPIATASMSTPVFDVVHMFSERGISAVPIVDENGIVVNLYETVDVIVRVIPFSMLQP